MRRVNFILWLSFLSWQLLSQHTADSLFLVWEDIDQQDSIRAHALEDYIYSYYFYSDPDSTELLLQELLEFSQQSNYGIGIVNAYDLAGYNFFRKGDYKSALECFKKGLDTAEKLDYKLGEAEILLKTGYIYHDNDDIVRALDYYQRSLSIYERLGNEKGAGSIYNELGSIYKGKGEFEKALEYYFKSIAISESESDALVASAQYMNVGDLYLHVGDYPKSLEYYNMGLRISERDNDILGIASGLAGLGDINQAMGEIEKALAYLERSLQISLDINDVQGGANTRIEIGNIYYDKEHYNQAIRYCQLALQNSITIENIGGQENACDCLYRSYKELGDFVQALNYLEETFLLYDSISSDESSVKLKEMEFYKQVIADSLAQVEIDTKVALQHQIEIERQSKNRNIAIGIGVFFLLLSGGFFSRWRYVQKSNAIIKKERDRSDSLLLNILPAEIAEELKEKGEAEARDHELVTIIFSDFEGYTEKSAELTAQQLVKEINDCFKYFDQIAEKYRVEKIKTIGDAYMAAGGIPSSTEYSVVNTVKAAIEMQQFITDRFEGKKGNNEIAFEMRLGIHTGPVVAGIVGVKKFQYDIWGDTVNIASRMESNGEIGKVNVSNNTYEAIKDDPQFLFTSRGEIEVKGKGRMRMWFVEYRNKEV